MEPHSPGYDRAVTAAPTRGGQSGNQQAGTSGSAEVNDLVEGDEVVLASDTAQTRRGMRSTTERTSDLCKRRKLDVMDIGSWYPPPCCKRDCIDKVGIERCRKWRETFLNSRRDQRKALLLDFVTMNGEMENKQLIVQDVQPCWNFFRIVMDVSRTLISNVRCLSSATASHLPGRLGGSDGSHTKTSQIIAFLSILADKVADEIPNSNERHLPHGNKKFVYLLYCEETRQLQQEPCQGSHFYRTWKRFLPMIRCRRNHGFSACDTCITQKERLLKLSRMASQRTEMALALNCFKQHLHLVRRERAEYALVRSKASEPSNEILSVIIDGADQAKFGLPRFPVAGKRETGFAMKQKLTGVLFHGAVRKNDFLAFFTSADNVPGGANQTVDAFCRGLFALMESRQAVGVHKLPSNLYIQLDNTGKDNKNRYFFAFCELLVHRGVFESVTVNFLPVGHTHEDIDRKFSHISTHLRHLSVVTVEDLHAALRQSQGRLTPHVARINGMHNFSGALNQQNRVASQVPNMQTFRKFTFERHEEGETAGDVYSVSCNAAFKMGDKRDDWIELPRKAGFCGVFLREEPDVECAPAIKMKSYTEKEIKGFETRLRKTEVRINSREKSTQLKEVLAELINPPKFDAEWSFDKLFSVRPISGNASLAGGGEDDVDDDSELVRTVGGALDDGLQYSEGDMVTVYCGQKATPATPFWLGKILSISRPDPMLESILTVQWYDVDPKGAPATGLCYTGRYKPMTCEDGSPFSDEIASSSVAVDFASLTTRERIPTDVQKLTAEALDPFQDHEDEDEG